MQHKSILKIRQGNLSFSLPRAQQPEEFREACSRWLCDESRLGALDQVKVRSLFNHDAVGRPANGLSPFRFDCEANWGHVYALGESSVALLADTAAALGRATFPTPWLGRPKWSESVVEATETEALISYWMPQVIVCKNAEQHQAWKAAGSDDKKEHVQDVIKRGIERQITLLTGAATTFVPMPAVFQIQHERAIPRLRGAQANAFVRVAAVGFELALKLDGHWVAGGLVNRGYGRILPVGR